MASLIASLILLFVQCNTSAAAAAKYANRAAFVSQSSRASKLLSSNVGSSQTATIANTMIPRSNHRTAALQRSTTALFSLKPAAIPLMDSGKALARSGELLIDLTTQLSLYGGSLSAAGACIRNAGDCLAQAAASCRFKTAAELVIDELREGADCLKEGVDKLYRASEESGVDGDDRLQLTIEEMIPRLSSVALSLEDAGRSILDREAVKLTGAHLVSAGEALEGLASVVERLDEGSENARLSSQRMGYASQQMVLAGRELGGSDEKKAVKGKAWLKGGG
ncbi:hypothetical protein ACHAWO_008720 [Cyclotella atomus]|uniref:Uncharacterized protein n=1 Tax=Cyclotella atomus TaxID=382360 RepID=A0ABD3PXY9_9STRA